MRLDFPSRHILEMFIHQNKLKIFIILFRIQICLHQCAVRTNATRLQLEKLIGEQLNISVKFGKCPLDPSPPPPSCTLLLQNINFKNYLYFDLKGIKGRDSLDMVQGVPINMGIE